ncbi:MAG: acetate--CoA ligase family protein [Chitinispirillaceae bacterium]|nr:acetate--CoA ligase family protein [Chitinispirillaceae bacterium]
MSFEKLLTPSSVAIIGASKDKKKVGNNILVNLISGGFKGEIYPVNPGTSEIEGKKCYSSVKEIPKEVDLAVIVVKRDLVLPTLKECVEKNIKSVIIITAGFGETGEEGKALQKEIINIAKLNGITLLGPNCLGLINTHHNLNASFGQGIGIKGEIAFISQSGALITAIQDMAVGDKIGFSILASLGNKAVLDEIDFLHHLQKDKTTKVICAYLEDVHNGQEFMKVAEHVNKVKPIIVLKSGRTASGAKAASSHTGSLAGSDSAYNCAFKRSGVIRAESIEHLFDVATALAYQPLPEGDRVAVITNAGGPGIMMSDALEMVGLKMATIDEETKEKLRSFLSPAASLQNPVDILGDASADTYKKAIEVVLESKNVDSLIIILTPQKMTEIAGTASTIVEIGKKNKKPIFCCFMGSEVVREGVRILKENHIPQYPVPERAAKAMRDMVLYSEYKRRPLRVIERFAVNKIPVIRTIKANISRGSYEIGEFDAKTILEAYKFIVPPGGLATNVDEAVRFANEVGYPVAMKISSPDILHKSDVGGVKIGLYNAQAVEDAFELMMLRIKRKKPEAEIRGVLIEKMIMGGREVILGMKKDPQFGPMIMYGLGGIFVEVLKDVSFGLAPLTEEECFKMIESTRSYKLLLGARGEQPVDVSLIVGNLQRLSQLVMDFPEIEEVDINPLKVGQVGDNAYVVDARIILSKEGRYARMA